MFEVKITHSTTLDLNKTNTIELNQTEDNTKTDANILEIQKEASDENTIDTKGDTIATLSPGSLGASQRLGH